MQSAKNRMKVLSALSMAAAATFAVRSANAASLSLYYGNTAGTAAGTNTSNATGDGIWVGNSTGSTSTHPTSFKTAKGNLQGTPTQITPNVGTPTTITVPIGQYLSISINALLTGDTNGDGGKSEVTTKGGTAVEPANLGLSALGIRIPVSANDANGSILQPVNNGATYTSFNSVPGFNSYATVNTSTTTPGGPAAPQWQKSTPGDLEANSGSVGANNQIFGGNSTPASNALEIPELQQFSASSAAYGNSTEFFQGLVYQGLSAGVVTLSPFADSTGTQYWTVLTPASGVKKGVYQTATGYQPSYFGTSDTIGTLPVLVIDVVGTQSSSSSSSHAILSLTSAAPTAYGSSSGTLAVTGSNGKYNLAQITGLSDVTNYVEATGWNPATDEEIYGLDVLVNGNAANGNQLATLINAINGDSSGDGASAGVSASTTNPGGAFPGGYNLFLTYAGGGFSPDFLGVDLSSSNDSNLAGYSFSEVAAVPEPMTIGLLAVGSVGLMARRNRRKA
jgi:hypothetical protein